MVTIPKDVERRHVELKIRRDCDRSFDPHHRDCAEDVSMAEGERASISTCSDEGDEAFGPGINLGWRFSIGASIPV